MKKILSLCCLAMLFLGWACTEENETTFVVTEEILYASGEQVRLLGRVISNQSVQVQDHGFYLSKDPNFASPIILSLGAKDGPGRFIGQVSDLEVNQLYYAKSFFNTGAGDEFGNVVEVRTLPVGLESFSPTFGATGQEMTIIGRNFTKDTKVFFGSVEAQIISITLESRIRVRIPAPKDGVTVPIKIQVQNNVVEFPEKFEYRVGTYELITAFPQEIKVYDNVFFQRNSGLHIGLGSERRLFQLEYFQRYDIATKTWDRVEFPGSPRSYAFFTDNYIGGGTARLGNPIVINSSFWRITDSGFEQLGDLPFESRESLAFEINSTLYVLGTKQSNEASFRKYNPVTKVWSSLGTPPENFNAENAHFIYQGRAYVIGKDKSVWSYTPSSDSWQIVSSYPGGLGDGYGMGRVIGDKAYVGLYRRSDELWELNLNTLTWKPKNPMPGLPQSILVGHFVKDGVLYIMRVPDITLAGSYPMNMYKFTPEGF